MNLNVTCFYFIYIVFLNYYDIPEKWRKTLIKREYIEELCARAPHLKRLRSPTFAVIKIKTPATKVVGVNYMAWDYL